jgi:hypothetical protein
MVRKIEYKMMHNQKDSMKRGYSELLILSLMLLVSISALAQNPFITDQYTADPSARVFGDRVYVYPSHDILATKGRGRVDWFCMEDYHVFSSSNLTDWTDHGVIVSQDKVAWGDPEAYSMWAPDCIYRNGKYYFYFPDIIRDTLKYGRGFSVGVAIADAPEGPYAPLPEPIKGVHGIDPNVFIDKDGQAYLYWALGNLYAASLKENMTELASEPMILEELPEEGLKEGPYLFEREGTYYLTYPHVQNKTERLEYATSDNPLGPFKFAGVIMDESPTGCWTNHQSIISFKDQWYLFYHHNDFSPNFDKNRSMRIDSLFFNADGTIRKVIPTLRGVGITKATKRIQPDRYSATSENGTSIAFLDSLDRFKGWKTILEGNSAWVRYNSIDFGSQKLSLVQVKALSSAGGVLELRLDQPNGPMIAEVRVPKEGEWAVQEAALFSFSPGIHHLFITPKENSSMEIDWVRFK